MDVFNYESEGQISIFDLTMPLFKITKPIRLIELFGGVGSQAMALRNIGADFEHYRLVEFDKFPVASYNAIHGTNFEPTDIRNIHGEDLGIVDVESFTYLLTYSFPCVDLSVAGKQKGMKKGSGTRSGLLWEVERLLNECEELPQVLLMENVPQVHSKDNMPDFQNWIDFLTSKGYSNYWQDLNARDFGVAQNRNRCFMVSILGEYNYKFPKPIPLDKTMKDYLMDEVDDKYYITNEKAKKLIEQLILDGKIPTRSEEMRLRDIDRTGFKNGKLTVIRYAGFVKNENKYWVCRCECGNEVVLPTKNLKSVKSCGCLQKEKVSTHGQTQTRLYKIWHSMKTRCLNENAKNFKYYGGNGISICEQWIEDFTLFYKWAHANGYSEELTLDRVDNTKDYCPENCRWVSQKEQCNNRTSNRIIEYDGEKRTMSEWAEWLNIPYSCLNNRINNLNWDIEKALTTPYKTKIIPTDRQTDRQGND